MQKSHIKNKMEKEYKEPVKDRKGHNPVSIWYEVDLEAEDKKKKKEGIK